MVGNPLVTVKVAVTEPAAVVRVTVRAPVAAVPVITKFAVCEVADPPASTVAVTPVPLTPMLAPVRFVPVIVTGTP